MINTLRINVSNIFLHLALWFHPSKEDAKQNALIERHDRMIYGESFFQMKRIDPTKVIIHSPYKEDVPSVVEIHDKVVTHSRG